MKVKELMEILKKCNPESKVCIEANQDCCANVVQEYRNNGETFVYIADELDYIDEVLVGAVKTFGEDLSDEKRVGDSDSIVRREKTMKVKKVIINAYYDSDGDYMLFEDNLLHNTSYNDVNVSITKIVRTVYGMPYVADVIEISGQEPIECELIDFHEEDGVLLLKICQDWG